MLFVLNIGNTNVHYGVYTNGGFENIQSCPTSAFSRDLLPDDMPLACACVVPSVLQYFDGLDVFFITAEVNLGFDLEKVDSTTIGADRLANAAGLSLGNLPALCIDCGTALTFEAVNDKREFIGGAIAPGRALMRKALNDHTALLPSAPFVDSIPTIGTTTVEAITVGIDRGIIGSVKEIISSISNDTSFRTVAIGGDADFLCNNIPELTNGGDSFTLLGIVDIWKRNQ